MCLAALRTPRAPAAHTAARPPTRSPRARCEPTHPASPAPRQVAAHGDEAAGGEGKPAIQIRAGELRR